MRTRATPLRLAALAILVFLAGDRLIAAGLGWLVLQSPDRFVSVYRDAAPADVVVLGNSRVDRHFDPGMIRDRTGLEIVNLGIGLNSVALSEVLLADYLERHPKPQSIVLEVTHLQVPVSTGELKLLTAFSANMRAFLREVSPRLYYAGEVSHLFRLNSDLFFRALYSLLAGDEARLFPAEPGAIIAEEKLDAPERMIIAEGNGEALARIAAMAREEGIRLVLVVAPYYPDFLARIENMDAFVAEVEAIAGQSVIDLSGLPVGRDDFYDLTHLDAAGVGLFIDALLAADPLTASPAAPSP